MECLCEDKKLFIIIFFLLHIKTASIKGEATYPEEAVDPDYPAGTEGKGELFEREEQPHLYAAKGEYVYTEWVYISVYISIMYTYIYIQCLWEVFGLFVHI